MKKLTFLQALNLSIIKWEYISKKGGGTNFYIYSNHPELRGLESGCGLCEYYKQLRKVNNTALYTIFNHCIACPFGKVSTPCSTRGSMLSKFIVSSNKKIEYAEKILEKLYKIKKEHQTKQFLNLK